MNSTQQLAHQLRAHSRCARIDKAITILYYEPKVDFKEGLKYTHQWFKENWNDIERSEEFSRGELQLRS